MKAKQLFRDTFDFKELPRPIKWETPGIWGATRKRWIAEGYDKNITGRGFFEHFDMEAPIWLPFKGGWTGNPYSPMFGTKLINDDDVNIIHVTKDGITKKERKYDRETSMPQFLEFPVKNKNDYEKKIKFRMDYNSDERFPKNWRSLITNYKESTYPLGMFIIGPFGYLRNLLGDENLMYLLFDEPDFVHQIMNDWMNFYLGFIPRVTKDILPDFVMVWEDISYNMGPLISPMHFKEFMSPYLTKILDLVKKIGIKGRIVDTDGNCNSMIPIYLDCGANGFYPFEVQAGMEIVELKKQYGDSFVIIGGIDKKTLAIDEEAIMNEVDSKVPFMLENKGYIPMLDHTVPPDIPLKNFEFFINYVRRGY
ncbi:MAG: hypothetical protein KAG94_06290 [Clostridiales bacterium]|nr:hypothetical protein [Clostridiales bacterium]